MTSCTLSWLCGRKHCTKLVRTMKKESTIIMKSSSEMTLEMVSRYDFSKVCKTALGRNCVSGATSGNLLSDDSMKIRSIWKNIQDCIILKSKSCRYQNITSGAWKFGGMCMGVAAALAVSTCLSPLSIILYRYFWNWFCDLRTIWNDRKV